MRREKTAAEFMNIIGRVRGLDAKYAVDYMGGSEELYKQMLSQIVRLTPSNIERMDDFLASDDLSSFGIISHGIKGAMRQAGAMYISKSAESLEMAAKSGDLSYCRTHYGAFRDELLRLTESITGVFDECEGDTEDDGENKSPADIREYIDALECARNAAEDYDSLQAVEFLLPLEKKRFGNSADVFIKNAVEALRSFQPQTAFEYITELLESLEAQ